MNRKADRLMAWGNFDKVAIEIDKHEYGHLLLARDAAQMLVDAYKRGAECGACTEWDDIDQAHEMACEAVDLSRCPVCKAVKHGEEDTPPNPGGRWKG